MSIDIKPLLKDFEQWLRNQPESWLQVRADIARDALAEIERLEGEVIQERGRRATDRQEYDAAPAARRLHRSHDRRGADGVSTDPMLILTADAVAFLERIAQAMERFSDDYATVHALRITECLQCGGKVDDAGVIVHYSGCTAMWPDPRELRIPGEGL